jgi:hypothetical protein
VGRGNKCWEIPVLLDFNNNLCLPIYLARIVCYVHQWVQSYTPVSGRLFLYPALPLSPSSFLLLYSSVTASTPVHPCYQQDINWPSWGSTSVRIIVVDWLKLYWGCGVLRCVVVEECTASILGAENGQKRVFVPMQYVPLHVLTRSSTSDKSYFSLFLDTVQLTCMSASIRFFFNWVG